LMGCFFGDVLSAYDVLYLMARPWLAVWRGQRSCWTILDPSMASLA
jgi:hypothetical protein